MGAGDDEASGDFDEVVKAVTELAEYGVHLAEERRARPGDDLTTNLVQAEVDGERLTSAEIASFFILLSAAGNETTRNAISHGMVALTRYPEERREVVVRLRRRGRHRRRGDRAVGFTDHLHAPQSDRGHRDCAASR